MLLCVSIVCYPTLIAVNLHYVVYYTINKLFGIYQEFATCIFKHCITSDNETNATYKLYFVI